MPLSSYQRRLFCFAPVHFGMHSVLVTGPQVFRALRETAPTVIIGPPALFEIIETQGSALAVRAQDLGECIRTALGGGARVLIMGMAKANPAMLKTYETAKLPLFEVYGLTECGVAAVNRPEERR